ncbi:MAG TPA: carboxypeptidase regulatory-like domain-containing protein [Terriglobales bacterium]|nr:carboxypeptidase regulatory-like domain-containing protein [Terriglobales bacterium]
MLIRFTKSFCLLVAFTLCIATYGQSNHGVLTVNVADAIEKAPIARAFIFVHGHTGSQAIMKNHTSAGHYDISLAPGLYDIFVTAPAFAPTCKIVVVNSGETTTYNVTLKADDEHLEQATKDF